MSIGDDVAEFGHNEVEHNANLHNLMRVSREHGSVFNSKKCAIKTPQISFFDTIYDEKGVHPDPKKVEDIKMLPTPESRTELEEFFGDCHVHELLSGKRKDHKCVSAVTYVTWSVLLHRTDFVIGLT